MAETADDTRLSGAQLREWRKRLLHGDWRLWDLEFFHVLIAAISALIALLVSITVVGMTRLDGNVDVAVAFAAGLVAILVVVRAAARAGLHSAERRTAATAALAARSTYLDAVGRGARVRAGAASTWVTKSAADIGTYVARAVPARAVATWLPFALLLVVALVDFWSAVVCAVALAVAPFILVILGKRAAAEADVGLGRLRSLATRALELLEGAVELRALGALRRGRDELAAATDRAVESTRRSLRIGLQSASALDLLAGLAVGLVAMVDGFRLLGGSITLGHGLAAVLLVIEVFAPLRIAGAAFHAGADGRAALGTLDAVHDDAGPPSTMPRSDLATVAATPAAVSARSLTLVPGHGAPPILEDLEFTVASKGDLLVAGPSGCGKTTLLRAIAGAPFVASGTLIVGNAEPERFSARQRGRLIAAVDQRPFLVAGSVRENLVLGGVAASDAALRDAMHRCGIDPSRLDEAVGEEGRLLSAGERTRVALARAVLRNPGVLLLDEVAAHLDDAALDELRSSLAEFLAGRTVIEAAHDRPLLRGAARLELHARAVT